jgi:hypothetical protein
MWCSYTTVGWKAYIKVVVSRGVLTTIAILIHRMMMAMMQVELRPWQNTLRHKREIREHRPQFGSKRLAFSEIDQFKTPGSYRNSQHTIASNDPVHGCTLEKPD